MREITQLLKELNKEDIEWLFSEGVEKTVILNTKIINEGDMPGSIYIVLQGLLGVTTTSVDDSRIAVLGPGEIIGDISFLEKRPASASVFAAENSLLLVLPKEKIDHKIAQDQGFAVHFYKSLAILNSRRLRAREKALGLRLREKEKLEYSVNRSWEIISESIQEFKKLIHQADQEAIKNHGQVPAGIAETIQQGFREFCILINEQIGTRSPEPEHTKEEIGKRIKLEMLPYVLQAHIAERMYSKPRGYAGDYLTIQEIYKNEPSGTGRIGPLLDRCFLNEPAARAVRNRRKLLTAEILKVIQGRAANSRARVTSVACGPAAEVFDAFEKLDDPSALFATLVDIDLQALAFVDARCENSGLKRSMKLLSGNLVYLALGREKLDIEPQDLIYSIGLIDYFNDEFVVRLMNYLHGLLKPGGKIILGNFHPGNSSRAYMDHVMEWELVHRTEEDMDRLFSDSEFNSPCTNIQFEEEGINLFAECIRS